MSDKLGMDSEGFGRLGLSPGDVARIQDFANANQVVVNVVGSRAAGTSRAESDYDYALGDDGSTSRLRQRARRELPRGVAGGEVHPTRGETGMDVFRDTLDRSRPHITFTPEARRLPR